MSEYGNRNKNKNWNWGLKLKTAILRSYGDTEFDAELNSGNLGSRCEAVIAVLQRADEFEVELVSGVWQGMWPVQNWPGFVSEVTWVLRDVTPGLSFTYPFHHSLTQRVLHRPDFKWMVLHLPYTISQHQSSSCHLMWLLFFLLTFVLVSQENIKYLLSALPCKILIKIIIGPSSTLHWSLFVGDYFGSLKILKFSFSILR